MQISRSEVFLVDIVLASDSVTALRDSRDVVGHSALDTKPFAFSTVFIFVEQVWDKNRFGLHVFSTFGGML